jgi:hypothetical protein
MTAGILGSAVALAAGRWSPTSSSWPESVMTGLGLGLAEATVLLNVYLWAGRTASRATGSTSRPIPRKTAGWIWSAHQGAAHPLAVVQQSFRHLEIGTVLAVVLVVGEELALRLVQGLATQLHPGVGVGASVLAGVILAWSARQPWYLSLFTVMSALVSGIVHALVFAATGDLLAVLTAAAMLYLVLKRL